MKFVPPRHFGRHVISISACVACLWASGGLLAGNPLLRSNSVDRTSGCIDGNCPPNTSGFGFYPTSWRQWKGTSTYQGFRKPTPRTSIPAERVPDRLNEMRSAPQTRSEEPLEDENVDRIPTYEPAPAAGQPTLPPATNATDPFLTVPESELPDDGFGPAAGRFEAEPAESDRFGAPAPSTPGVEPGPFDSLLPEPTTPGPFNDLPNESDDDEINFDLGRLNSPPTLQSVQPTRRPQLRKVALKNVELSAPTPAMVSGPELFKAVDSSLGGGFSQADLLPPDLKNEVRGQPRNIIMQTGFEERVVASPKPARTPAPAKVQQPVQQSVVPRTISTAAVAIAQNLRPSAKLARRDVAVKSPTADHVQATPVQTKLIQTVPAQRNPVDADAPRVAPKTRGKTPAEIEKPVPVTQTPAVKTPTPDTMKPVEAQAKAAVASNQQPQAEESPVAETQPASVQVPAAVPNGSFNPLRGRRFIQPVSAKSSQPIKQEQVQPSAPAVITPAASRPASLPAKSNKSAAIPTSNAKAQITQSGIESSHVGAHGIEMKTMPSKELEAKLLTASSMLSDSRAASSLHPARARATANLPSKSKQFLATPSHSMRKAAEPTVGEAKQVATKTIRDQNIATTAVTAAVSAATSSQLYAQNHEIVSTRTLAYGGKHRSLRDTLRKNPLR